MRSQSQLVALGLIIQAEQVVVCKLHVIRSIPGDKPDMVDLLPGDLVDVLSAQPELGVHVP